MGSMHEYERAKIAERFRRGKMYKARSGKLVGYNAPYGYRYNKTSGEFEIYEPEAEVVRKMYNWVINDKLTTYSLIKRLHDEGIKPQKEKSEFWTRSPIARIMSNETYYGVHHFNKTEAILPQRRQKQLSKYRKIQKTGRRKRDKDEWIAFSVPPIITEATFKKARSQIEKNVIFNPKNRKHGYLLTSLVKCTCGANRNGDGPAGKKYYRCISRHRYYDRINRCKVGGLNVKVLDALVWEKIANLLTDPQQIRKHANRWLEQRSQAKTSVDSSAIKNKLRELENEQKRYAGAYGKGLMPETLFADKMKETQKAIELQETELAKASENRGITGKIDIEQLVAKATRKIGKLAFEQRKYIVEQVVDKVIASPQEITIWGHLPLPALVTNEKVNHVSQHRNRRSAECWEVDVV